MAHKPGSQELAQHRPHSYKGDSPEVHREADRLLEQLSHKLAKDKGITVEEAREELRHWV